MPTNTTISYAPPPAGPATTAPVPVPYSRYQIFKADMSTINANESPSTPVAPLSRNWNLKISLKPSWALRSELSEKTATISLPSLVAPKDRVARSPPGPLAQLPTRATT